MTRITQKARKLQGSWNGPESQRSRGHGQVPVETRLWNGEHPRGQKCSSIQCSAFYFPSQMAKTESSTEQIWQVQREQAVRPKTFIECLSCHPNAIPSVSLNFRDLLWVLNLQSISQITVTSTTTCCLHPASRGLHPSSVLAPSSDARSP